MLLENKMIQNKQHPFFNMTKPVFEATETKALGDPMKHAQDWLDSQKADFVLLRGVYFENIKWFFEKADSQYIKVFENESQKEIVWKQKDV